MTDAVTHRLDAAALAGVELPEEAKEVLIRGVPAEVALSPIMPTVFSSAIGRGYLLASPSGSGVEGYVIGSIREQQTGDEDLSWFVAERRTGHVYVTDGKSAELINSDLARFFASIRALLDVAEVAAEDDGAEGLGVRLSAELRQRLDEIDRIALAQDGYWRAWVDDFLTA
jgi:hypothetical protein